MSESGKGRALRSSQVFQKECGREWERGIRCGGSGLGGYCSDKESELQVAMERYGVSAKG